MFCNCTLLPATIGDPRSAESLPEVPLTPISPSKQCDSAGPLSRNTMRRALPLARRLLMESLPQFAMCGLQAERGQTRTVDPPIRRGLPIGSGSRAGIREREEAPRCSWGRGDKPNWPRSTAWQEKGPAPQGTEGAVRGKRYGALPLGRRPATMPAGKRQEGWGSAGRRLNMEPPHGSRIGNLRQLRTHARTP